MYLGCSWLRLCRD